MANPVIVQGSHPEYPEYVTHQCLNVRVLQS